MAYTIQDNIILSDILEVNVVDHCNLRCRSCTHLSPISVKRQIEPAPLQQQLSSLSYAYHAKKLRLLGGEPLLHKDLDGIIDASRNSNIGNEIIIVTNGQLPDKLTDNLLEKIDGLEISLYPEFGYKGNLEEIKARCAQYSCSLRVTEYNQFRESYAETPTKNHSLAQQVYNTCQIAHTWSCHNMQDGFFYKCPQAHVLQRTMPHYKNIPDGKDGISVFSESLFEKLTAYLENKKPLLACQTCLGSAGKLFNHEQITKNKWSQKQQRPYEDLVDLEFLDELKKDMDSYTGCYKDVYRSWDPT